MTEKLQKIRKEVERLKSNLIHGACASQIAMETRCKEEAYNEVLAILDTMQEEPKKCMYARDNYTDEDRKALCDGCEKDCMYAKLNTMLNDALSKETKESWNERLGKEEPKFKVGDTIRKINDGLEAKVTSVDNSGFIYAACEDWEQIIYPKDWKLVEEPSITEIVDEHFWEMLGEVPVSEEWIEELRTKLNSMSKEDFKKVFDKYAIDFNEEPVSEKLGEYINELSKQFPEVSFAKLSRIAVRVSRWQRNQDTKNKLPEVINRTDLDEYAYQCAYDMSNDWMIENPTWHDVEDACKLGANWQKENLWKSANGDDLPEYDREVIVLINYDAQLNIHDEEYPTYRVGFGHRPNPDGWDGKNIDTNEVTHYTPKLYDKGGWNAPNIVYWMDARLPYEENKIIKEL